MQVHSPNQLISNAEKLLREGHFQAADAIYQQLIEVDPDFKAAYWQLGLSLLLQKQEAEAQMCWMTALLDGTEAEIAGWTDELIKVLKTEAQYQTEQENFQTSWLIHQHLREIDPVDIDNILLLIQTSAKLDYELFPLITEENGVTALLTRGEYKAFDQGLFLSTLSLILRTLPVDDALLTLIKASLDSIQPIQDVRDCLVPIGMEIARRGYYSASVALGDLYLSYDPNDLEVLSHIPGWYSGAGDLQKAIRAANRRIQLSTSSIDTIFSRHLLIKLLLGTGGHWQEASSEIETSKADLMNLKDLNGSADVLQLLRLVLAPFFAPYIKDDPAHNRSLCNHVARIFSTEIKKITPDELQTKIHPKYLQPQEIQDSTGRKLRIGYLSYCLRQHSVGWIARWLIKHHDHDQFETYGYLINFDQSSSLQNWYEKQFDHARRIGLDYPDTGIQIAQQIAADEIDILVDLDSITLDLSCEVMARKPAPIQVTWLGWDASGIPEVDYYIADHHVLPEGAQNYYAEQIWRLPDAYLAVDGFEVEVPTLSRTSLGIPQDAVVYLTAQGGYKRNPEIIRLQLSVIQGVPGSYLLIKGLANKEAIQKHFLQIAEELGVAQERLRFLPMVQAEATHRANLRVADVILDTYPYNGATTTLETLWMEVPLVTLVGQQFSARNSYTMLKNVGVDEGIAWTPEEYIQWGIRLGTDRPLRQAVAWKLRESKRQAPLWNAKLFTDNIEKAYKSMWKTYVEKASVPT